MTHSHYSQPKPKPHCKLKPSQPLPIIETNSGEKYKFQGIFNGYNVVVDEIEDMKNLIRMGYFGKATLSRNFPQFNQHKPEIIRDRVFQNRKSWSENVQSSPEKIIVTPDSDPEEDYFTNLRPLYQLDRSGIKESVHLGLEEAFFLSAALECLDLIHEGKKLEISQTWKLFQESDRFFLVNYIAYYYFRAKEWVVKTGIKFGGDFLLYKQGPPFYHASFVVLINVVNESCMKIPQFSRRSMKYAHLLGINRLCETAGKELLICEIIWPNNVPFDQVPYDDLSKFTIKEVLLKRWHPNTQKKEDEPTPSTSGTI